MSVPEPFTADAVRDLILTAERRDIERMIVERACERKRNLTISEYYHPHRAWLEAAGFKTDCHDGQFFVLW